MYLYYGKIFEEYLNIYMNMTSSFLFISSSFKIIYLCLFFIFG